MNRSKQKGTAAETAVVRYLQAQGYPLVERRALSGVLDKGDISGLPVAVEVKDHRTMKLAQWAREAAVEGVNAGALAGICWHKKTGTTNPGEWYVTMTGEEWMKILKKL